MGWDPGPGILDRVTCCHPPKETIPRKRGAVIYFCVSTVPEDRASDLARQLLEEGLAACVNVLPGVRSIYRWKGEVRDEVEALLYIKTAPRTLGGFEDRFKKLHPYENPELLMIPVEDGLKDYFYWVEDNSGGAHGS